MCVSENLITRKRRARARESKRTRKTTTQQKNEPTTTTTDKDAASSRRCLAVFSTSHKRPARPPRSNTNGDVGAWPIRRFCPTTDRDTQPTYSGGGELVQQCLCLHAHALVSLVGGVCVDRCPCRLPRLPTERRRCWPSASDRVGGHSKGLWRVGGNPASVPFPSPPSTPPLPTDPSIGAPQIHRSHHHPRFTGRRATGESIKHASPGRARMGPPHPRHPGE